MSELLGSLFSAATSIGGAAAAPPPTTAYRGADYNPVTNVNAVGGVDFGKIGELVRQISAGQNAGAQTFFSSPAAGGSAVNQFFNPQTLIWVAVLGIAAVYIWKRYGK